MLSFWRNLKNAHCTLNSEKKRERKNSSQIWWHFIRKHLGLNICTYMYAYDMLLPWDNFTQRQEVVVPSCEIAFITLTHFSCTKRKKRVEDTHLQLQLGGKKYDVMWIFLFLQLTLTMYRHSSISAVSISAIFDLTRFIILSYFPPL